MNLKIISIGKFKNEHLLALEREFLKRLKPTPLKIEQIELKPSSSSDQNYKIFQKQEAEAALTQLKDDDFVIAMDEQGKKMTSPQLAVWFQEKMNSGQKSIVFIIGGAYGLHESLLKRANLKLSLSDLTFQFHYARLLLIEQIYRAHSIISGSSYHKE